MTTKEYIRKVYDSEDDDENLFSKSDLYLMSHDCKGKPLMYERIPSTTRKTLNLGNMKLLIGTRECPPVSIPIRFPEVLQYNGDVDFDMVPFSKRKRFLKKGYGIHFFEYDYLFVHQLSNNIDKVTIELMQASVVIAPDYSMLVGTDDEFFNVQSKWKSMLVTNHLQRCGIPVVPVATWGDAESLKWAFTGLPKHSIIAVCGVGHSRSQGSIMLWNYALQELERQLEPTVIIVYGPETTIPGLHTPVKFIKDYITKHFRK